MCTVSWSRAPDRLILLFNRDEQRTRSEALPPATGERGDPPLLFLAPRDPDGGGTWIFVNQAGWIGCLLNNYARPAAPGRALTSRGRLMLDLAGCPDPATFENTLRRRLDTDAFAPCFLLTLSLDEGPVLLEWDGRDCSRLDTPALPFHTTSSYRPEEVAAAREQIFRDTATDPYNPTPGELEAFHLQHNPRHPAFSIKMSRDDARTVSTTRIDLQPGRSVMRYRPADGGEFQSELTL